MRLDLWARLFAHAALGMAAACLVYSENYFVPTLQLCLPPFLVLLAIAFLSGDRWSLPSWGANALGLLIAAGAGGWVYRHLSSEDSSVHSLPMPAGLLPFLGPLLLALLVVGLFRQRGPGGFWLLQAIGLVLVCLACVLATGPLFAALLAGYTACAVGALVLHHLGEEAGRGRTPRAAAPTAGWLARFLLRYGLGVGALALAAFLATPRGGEAESWNPVQRFGPGGGRRVTGFSEEMDLRGGGAIEGSDEAAFVVRAFTRDGGGESPKDDLSPATRWRGVVLDRYEGGVWNASNQYRLPRLPPRRFPAPDELFDPGPGRFFIEYDVGLRQAGGLFLAEPLRLGPGAPGDPARLPVASLRPEDRHGLPLFFENPDSDTVFPALFFPQRRYHYVQVTAPGRDPDRVPAELSPGGGGQYVERLAAAGPGALNAWTRGLIDRLCAEDRYGLTPALRDRIAAATRGVGFAARDAYRVPPEHWEAVARGLSAYLATSGEFSYTLDLGAANPAADPTADFLSRTRRGNCERFASGLALMLRSQGVPARLIKGFRGADPQGDGKYVVRQSMAHAWVEALVPAAGGEGAAHEWLALDPTASAGAGPGGEAARAGGAEDGWAARAKNSAAGWWRDLVVNYNSDRQADIWGALFPAGGPSPLLTSAARGWPWAAGGLLALAGLLAASRRLPRTGRPRRASPPPGMALYARLLRLLGRRAGLRPGRAQTPREFGEAAANRLLAAPPTAPFADVPARVVDLLYRVRFGGEPLQEGEARALGERLDELAAALRA